MDITRDHTKSERERQLPYDIIYMWNLSMTQMNLPTKQIQNHVHRNQTGGCQGGGKWERIGLGVWDQQMQTGTYKMDKQHGPTVQHSDKA